ncbi:YbhN family protein [Patescibacteria group bacterium]
MKKYISVILTILFLSIFCIYFFQNQEDFKPLLQLSIPILVIISLLKVLTIFSMGLFIKIVLKPFKKKMSLAESFYISTLSTIGNYFMPLRGGAGIRAVYLKKKLKLSYSHFISTLSGNYIITFAVYSIIGLVSLILIQVKYNISSTILYIFFITLALVTLTLSLVKIPKRILEISEKPGILNRISKILVNIAKGWSFITSNKSLLVKLLFITFLNFLITASITFLGFKSIGVNLTFPSLLLYVSLSGTSLLISLTPGSIGIREGVLLLSASIIATTSENILQVAVIDRGLSFFVLLFLYIIIKVLTSLKVLPKNYKHEQKKE